MEFLKEIPKVRRALGKLATFGDKKHSLNKTGGHVATHGSYLDFNQAKRFMM